MSDPADKSDDLIAELAKLMATSPAGGNAAVSAPARPAALDPTRTTPPAGVVRIPGMDAPRTTLASSPAAQAEVRAPATGNIRIPGMDQPAPVSTSAPVPKFDFGKPVAAPVIAQEPLSSLADRLATRSSATPQRVEPALTPAPQPVRIPSDLKPVSENRSFGAGPALSVATPPVKAPQPEAPAGNGDFHFDFGFGQNPPVSASPPRPTPDPIADLIAAEMDDVPQAPAEAHVSARPVSFQPVPVARASVISQATNKLTISPVATAAPRPASNAPIPLKPVSVTPRPPESDRFAISPGVGLNMKPQVGVPLSPPPAARMPEPAPQFEESDPMSEIESLIGEAVRVELAAPGPVRVQAPQQVHVEVGTHEDDLAMPAPQGEAAPVVPPLTTQFAPRRTSLRDDGAAKGAEDTILAAAAATGAEVGRIEPSVGEDSPYRRLKIKPQRTSFMSGGMRQLVGIAVAGTLLLAAGLGLYWVLNMGRTAHVGAAAPQLTADTTPVKAKPETPVAADTETTRSPVLEQMDGVSQAPSAEQLVSTDEASNASLARDVTPTTETSESGLANRKVRTVTVRPDGTIVSGDDAVAGAEELPVDRPNVPDVPSTESTNLLGDGTAAAPEATVSDVVAPTTAASLDLGTQGVIDPTVVAPTPMSFPMRSSTPLASSAATKPVTAVVAGAQTPNGQIDLLGNSADPQAAAPVAQADAGSAVAYVQLASSPSEADANATVKSAYAKYGSLFGGTKLVVQRADLGQKGIKYRVRLPAASLSDANSICAQIKAQGGDCFATNG